MEWFSPTIYPPVAVGDVPPPPSPSGVFCPASDCVRVCLPLPPPCQVRVVRGGVELMLSCFDLLVGDVLLVEAGDILPADGLLYAGGQIK